MDGHAIFVVHRHEDDHLVDQLKALLRQHGCRVRDSSITSATPNDAKAERYIKAVILGRRIRRSGKVVVVVSPQTRDHWWVDWEIQFAAKKGKRIVGVWAPGAGGCDLPAELDRLGDALVDWDAGRIIAALEGEDLWLGSSGEAPAGRLVTRARCA